MRKIVIIFLSLLCIIGGTIPTLAINLDLYGSVAAHHEYVHLNEGREEFEHYLLINTKTRTTGSTTTFAYFDLDWRLPATFTTHANKTSDGVVNEAYLNISLLDRLVLTIGKKRFLSGVGLAYNPVDFIDAPSSPFHPDLKQGVYCWGLTYFQHQYAVDTVLIIADHPENNGYGIKLSIFSLSDRSRLHQLLFKRRWNKPGLFRGKHPLFHPILARSGLL